MCEGPAKVSLTLRLPVDRSNSFVVFLSWFEDGMLHKRPVKSLATRSSHFTQWDVFPPDRGIGRRNNTATLVFESRVEKRTYAVLRLFVWALVDWTTTVVQMARPRWRWVEANGVNQLMTFHRSQMCWEEFSFEQNVTASCHKLENIVRPQNMKLSNLVLFFLFKLLTKKKKIFIYPTLGKFACYSSQKKTCVVQEDQALY